MAQENIGKPWKTYIPRICMQMQGIQNACRPPSQVKMDQLIQGCVPHVSLPKVQYVQVQRHVEQQTWRSERDFRQLVRPFKVISILENYEIQQKALRSLFLKSNIVAATSDICSTPLAKILGFGPNEVLGCALVGEVRKLLAGLT